MSPRKLANFFCHAVPILTVLAILPGTASAGGADDARRFEEMTETTDQNQRDRICQEILSGRPTLWARYFCEGYQALREGRTAEADLALAHALDERPDLSLAARLYGDLCSETNRLDAAVTYYRRAIESQPERTDARFALGSLLLQRGREEDPKYLAEALEAFRQMTEQDPDSPDGWSNMGLVLTYLGRMSEAETMYRNAIERNPKDPLLFDSLASLCSRMDRNDAAEENWRRAIGLNPGYGPAVIELAALEARTGKLLDAIAVLETGRTGVKAAPFGPRVRRNLGFAYLRLGLPETARARLEEAVASGQDALAALGLGHLLMIENETAGALDALDAGCALDSVLAIPFVQAWKAKLEPDQIQAHPALTRVVAAIRRGVRSPAGSGQSVLPAGTSGEPATPFLTSFVLEGWSFDESEKVKEQIRNSSADSLGAGYDTPPVPIKQVPAEFSESAEDAGFKGTVQVLVTVDENGHVVETKIKDCQAPFTLCDAALKAARKWTFRPATRYGQPVRAAVVLPFRFVNK